MRHLVLVTLIVGSMGPWVEALMFTAGGLDTGAWGKSALTLGLLSGIALLVVLSIPFIIAALSLGLLISTVAQNQAQALQMTLLITMPSILMSSWMAVMPSRCACAMASALRQTRAASPPIAPMAVSIVVARAKAAWFAASVRGPCGT